MLIYYLQNILNQINSYNTSTSDIMWIQGNKITSESIVVCNLKFKARIFKQESSWTIIIKLQRRYCYYQI
jgi:hypothetical protein